MSSSRTYFWTFAFLTTTLLLVSSLVTVVEALPCNCNLGKIVQATPYCQCECLEGFQLPDCDYHIDETVRLDVYVDVNQSSFSSDILVEDILEGTLLSNGTVKFIYAIPLNDFGKTNILMTMPGYGVRRFLPMVERREVWVQRAKIESAYVIPIPVAPANPASALPAFEYNGYTITVDSMMWVIAAFILCFWMIVIESCCCFANDEDTIGELGYAEPDEQAPQGKYAHNLDGLNK